MCAPGQVEVLHRAEIGRRARRGARRRQRAARGRQPQRKGGGSHAVKERTCDLRCPRLAHESPRPPGQRCKPWRRRILDASPTVMARISLLLAMALVAMAALFAQLPLASAADSTVGGGGGSGSGGGGGFAGCRGNCPGSTNTGGAGGGGTGGGGGSATSTGGSTPSGCVLARACVLACSLCSCTGARVLACLRARSAAAQERPWTQRTHAGQPPAAAAAPGALPAAHCAPALLRAAWLAACSAALQLTTFSFSAQDRRHRRRRRVPRQLPPLHQHRRRRRRRRGWCRWQREQRAEPRQVAGEGPWPGQAAGAQAAGLSASVLSRRRKTQQDVDCDDCSAPDPNMRRVLPARHASPPASAARRRDARQSHCLGGRVRCSR